MEPTETESKQTLDKFIESMLHLARKAKAGGAEAEFKAAPMYAPRRRLDETKAARKPILRWSPPESQANGNGAREAAE